MIPQVSVIMSVYNGERYVSEAIESILQQSFSDWELIVIDDNSSDGSSVIIRQYLAQDQRVKLINNEQNFGLTKSLNIGIKDSTGKYIARLDADDSCLPDRLQKQYDFMEAHPEMAVCGSCGNYIDESGEVVGKKTLPTEYREIKKKLLFNNQFIHSSLFICRAMIDKEGGYDESFRTSQDYELMLRIASKYPVANLPEQLVNWRVGEGSISWSSKRQEWDAIRARWVAVARYGYPKLNGLTNIILRLGWLALPQTFKMKRYLIK